MRIGVDLGGTKIEAIALGDSDGAELWRRRVPTPAGDYAGTVRAVAELVRECEAELGAAGTVGIGVPGTISPATGLMKNANSVCLIGQRLDRDLARALDRDIRLANDANCFALSEATDGAAAGAAVVFGVILGTGVGGGLVVNGTIVTGANAIGGEWGHNPLPEANNDAPECYCGRRGCVETFLSGPGAARDHEALTGERETFARIASRAASKDESAEATLARYERRLACALGTVINVVDPDVIVLGGGVSNLDRLYETVPRIWTSYVFSDHVATRLVRAAHGDSSGVRGAAWLWPVEP